MLLLKRFALALIFALAFAARAETPGRIIDVQPRDPNGSRARVLSNALRVIPFPGDALFAIAPSGEHGPNAMTATLLDAGSHATELRATQWLPNDAVMPETAGQVFGAALSDDGSTMAVSIGWTNAHGRNLNGLAIVDAKGFQVRHVVVFDGSVRDVVAGPDQTFAVVTTHPASNGRETLAVTIVGEDGAFRGSFDRRTIAIDDAEQEAINIRLQRLDERSIVVFYPSTRVMHLYEIQRNSTACASAARRGDAHFLYPRTKSAPCVTATSKRLLAFPDPEEAAGFRSSAIQALHLNQSGRLTVIRDGFDGTQAFMLITIYGAPGGMRTSVSPGVWKGISIREGVAEALLLQPHAASEVRLSSEM
jgi:hypothetical protein